MTDPNQAPARPSEAMKECPFCGSSEVYVESMGTRCKECGTFGPMRDGAESVHMYPLRAIAAWNRRAADPRAAAGDFESKWQAPSSHAVAQWTKWEHEAKSLRGTMDAVIAAKDEWRQRAERAEAERDALRLHYEKVWAGQVAEAVRQRDDERWRAEQAEARVAELADDVEHWKTEHAILADRLRGKVHPLDNGIPIDGPEQPAPRREFDGISEDMVRALDTKRAEVRAGLEQLEQGPLPAWMKPAPRREASPVLSLPTMLGDMHCQVHGDKMPCEKCCDGAKRGGDGVEKNLDHA